MKIFLVIILLVLITVVYVQQQQINRFTTKVMELVQLLDAIHELIGDMMDRLTEEENDKKN